MLVCSPAKTIRPAGTREPGAPAADRSSDRNRHSRRAPRGRLPTRSSATRAARTASPATSMRSMTPRSPSRARMSCSSRDARPPARKLRIPGGPRCCSLPSQMAPIGRSRAEGDAAVPRLLPEAPVELQQQPRRAAVAQVRDRVVLRLGQRAARTRSRAPCSRGQRADEDSPPRSPSGGRRDPRP